MSMPSDRFRLHMLGLPRIESLDDLSALTHLSKGLIFRLCQYADHFYRAYEIPKKSGGRRTIAQPSRETKPYRGGSCTISWLGYASLRPQKGLKKGRVSLTMPLPIVAPTPFSASISRISSPA